MNIATGCIGHETNTFSAVPTTLESFKDVKYHTGSDLISAFRGTSTITGGFIDRSEKLGIELKPLLWTFATPSGTVKHSAYDCLKSELIERLKKSKEIDGVLLDLHGAMVTTELEDAEGDLLREVRQVIGSKPIVTTLDLHANITTQMAEFADVIIGFDTYPHVDCYERGLEATDVINNVVRGHIKPFMSYRQLPLLTPPPSQCTMKPTMKRVLQRLHELESKPGVVTATLSMGFPFADIHDAGASVLVTSDGDPDLAKHYANKFAQHLWDIKDDFRADLVSIEKAIQHSASSTGHPIIFSEGSDNPGGGGPCDGTHILRALIEADVQNALVAIITDPESVQQAINAGQGHDVQLNLGGKTDPLHGEPVRITGQVKTITDGVFVHKGPMRQGTVGNMGRTVVVQVGGVEIIVSEKRIQPFDAEVIRSVGIDPEDRKIVVLKSAVHFRADFTPFAHEILDVDTPGVHSPNLFSYKFENLRRPIFPLDPEAKFD